MKGSFFYFELFEDLVESFFRKSSCLKSLDFNTDLLQIILFDPLQEVIFQLILDFVGLSLDFHEFVQEEQSFENLDGNLGIH